MELHNVNRGKVDELIHRFAQAANHGDYSVADVIIAIAEFSGRILVQMGDTPISGTQLAQVFETHVKRTLVAGYSAKGFNMGETLNG